MTTTNRRNDEVTFELMEHIGVLSERKDGWTKEVNMVSWNGGPAKVDIRDWDPDHERMSRGITLFEELGERLAKVLSEYKEIPGRYDISSFKENKTQGDEVSVNILEHIGIIDERSNGWSKEVNIVSWNGMVPKIDIRDWDPDHERMTRGITLTEEEAFTLANRLSERYNHKVEKVVDDDMTL